MKRILKKDSKDFQTKVINMFIKYGAEPDNIRGYKDDIKGYKINTKLGSLHVSVFDDNIHIYSIYSRFYNVELARQFYKCNPYNGKYNFFDSDKECCINQFERYLAELVP